MPYETWAELEKDIDSIKQDLRKQRADIEVLKTSVSKIQEALKPPLPSSPPPPQPPKAMNNLTSKK